MRQLRPAAAATRRYHRASNLGSLATFTAILRASLISDFAMG
jgi:hypothetical protein